MCCDAHMSRPSEFDKMESQFISNRMDEALHYNDQNEMPNWYGIPSYRDQCGIHLSSINTTLDPITFSRSLINQSTKSNFGMLVGITTTHIVLTDVGALFEDLTVVEVSAVYAELPTGVKPFDIDKV